MKMKSIYILLSLMFFAISLVSQNFTISGIIKDSSSSENLIGVTIAEQNKQKFTSCNEYGFYSLVLPKGKNVVVFDYIGFEAKIYHLDLQKDTVINVDLSSKNIELQQIVVTSSCKKMNSYNLPMKKINNMPTIAGETDVLKMLVLTPGVSAGSEGSASLNVRGGSPDQNLFLLDGVPVYNVNHVFGYFSVFNTDALKSVKLIKGGISAQYNGRTSSIVDMYMKEGDMQELHGNFSIGLISSKFLLEGPIIKDKSSFLITGRRTYIDALFRPISKSMADNTITGFYFYDINLKINYKLSDKHRVFFSFYTGKDKGYVEQEEDLLDNFNSIYKGHQYLSWGNITGAVRLVSILSSKISINNTLFYTKFNYFSDNYSFEQKTINEITRVKQYSYNSGSSIQDIGFRTNLDFYFNSSNTIKAGFTVSQKQFSPSFTSEYYNDQFTEFNIENLSLETIIDVQELSIYIEDNVKYGFFNANIGVNFNGFNANNKFYHFVEPRVSILLLINDNFNFQTSFTNVHQYVHLLSNSVGGMPTDLWVPSTESIEPINSNIYDVGFEFNSQKGYLCAVSSYYKSFENLIKYQQGVNFIDIKTDWQNKVTTGKGFAYGVELLLQKMKGEITGHIAYTYSRSFRTFEEVNNGNIFPYSYDRPHNLNIQAEYHIKKNVLFSTNFVLMSGQNTTFATQNFVSSDLNGFSHSYYDGYNNIRFPLYHRLDIAFIFTKQRVKTTRVWNVGIYNVYNRLNPYYLEKSNSPDKLVGVSFAPIMPFFSYSLKF